MATRNDIMSYYPYEVPRLGHAETLRAVESLWDSFDVALIVMPMGCHAVGQGIIMADLSTKKIEDIQVGEQVMGPDGSPRNVLTQWRGENLMKRIVPKSGVSFVVTENHILSLHRYITHWNGRGAPKTYASEKVEMSVAEYESLSNNQKNSLLLWKPEQLVYSDDVDVELPIDPYLLGIWLGDGNSDSLALTNMDQEIIDYWRSFAVGNLHVREEINNQGNNKAKTYYISNPLRTGNDLWKRFTTLNLKNNKHIPDIYLRASIKQRRALLAGLLDTDAHFDTKVRSVEFTQKREVLMNAVVLLARSLGFSCRINTKIVNGDTYYRTAMSGKFSDLPLLRGRHLGIGCDSHADRKRTRFSVETLGVDKYFGIEVDGDNLYLMDDFTVTHNSGKTAIRRAISYWAGDVNMFVPTNALILQELDEFPDTAKILNKKDFYHCDHCYNMDLARARERGTPVLTVPHMAIAQKLRRRIMVIDEGHKLVDVNRDLQSVNAWRRDTKYPLTTYSREQLEQYLQLNPTVKNRDKLLAKLRTRDYMVKRESAAWRNKNMDRMRLIPMTPDLHPSLSRGVEKIILLSATLSKEDVTDLGVGRNKRVLTIEAPSPIPAANRPLIRSYVGGLSFGNMEAMAPMIARRIMEISNFHSGKKGLVHVTYGLARILRAHLPSERFIWHDAHNAKERLAEWMATRDGVYMGSGCEEGLDLKGPDYEWQIISKIQWPSLADVAIRKRADESQAWYLWAAARKFIQAYGRICRGPTDEGVTYVLDSTFERLATECNKFGLLPKFFREIL